MDIKTKEKKERGRKFYGEYKGKPPFCADFGLCHRAFVMTLGVAISVKSNLGVSPVNSTPYIHHLRVGLEMGKATILFHVVLVLFQILLLRRAFQAKKSAPDFCQGFCSDILQPSAIR